MSKTLNFPDITLMTEQQKSMLFFYMNCLIARNNALTGLAHIAFAVFFLGIVTLYVVPTLKALVEGQEFTPVVLEFVLWGILPAAYALMLGAFIIAWRYKAWNAILYNFEVRRLQSDFMMRFGLDIRGLSVNQIWSGVVEN